MHPISGMAGDCEDMCYIIDDICFVSVAFFPSSQLLFLHRKSADSHVFETAIIIMRTIMIIHDKRGCSIAVGS